MTALFGRRYKLIVADDNNTVIDLSQLRFRFNVRQSDVDTPDNAMIRVYNLAHDEKGANTQGIIRSEFTQVSLEAGYEGANESGIVFSGTIKQFIAGRESNVNSFLDIAAADGDIFHNFGVLGLSLSADQTSKTDVYAKICKEIGIATDPTAADILSRFGGTLPRGKVLFGMWRAQMRDIAASTKCRWFISNGVAKLVPLTGYLPGEIVKINSETGMVGVPQATDQGIQIKCLLNPKIVIGQRVQINNGDISFTTIKEQGFPQYNALQFPASLAEDGIYRVMVAEHNGDTRGLDWHSDLTCLAIDPMVDQSVSVQAYG